MGERGRKRNLRRKKALATAFAVVGRGAWP